MTTQNQQPGADWVTQLLQLALGGSIADGENEAGDVYIDGVQVWPDPGMGIEEPFEPNGLGGPASMDGQRISPEVLRYFLEDYLQYITPEQLRNHIQNDEVRGIGLDRFAQPQPMHAVVIGGEWSNVDAFGSPVAMPRLLQRAYSTNAGPYLRVKSGNTARTWSRGAAPNYHFWTFGGIVYVLETGVTLGTGAQGFLITKFSFHSPGVATQVLVADGLSAASNPVPVAFTAFHGRDDDFYVAAMDGTAKFVYRIREGWGRVRAPDFGVRTVWDATALGYPSSSVEIVGIDAVPSVGPTGDPDFLPPRLFVSYVDNATRRLFVRQHNFNTGAPIGNELTVNTLPNETRLPAVGYVSYSLDTNDLYVVTQTAGGVLSVAAYDGRTYELDDDGAIPDLNVDTPADVGGFDLFTSNRGQVLEAQQGQADAVLQETLYSLTRPGLTLFRSHGQNPVVIPGLPQFGRNDVGFVQAVFNALMRGDTATDGKDVSYDPILNAIRMSIADAVLPNFAIGPATLSGRTFSIPWSLTRGAERRSGTLSLQLPVDRTGSNYYLTDATFTPTVQSDGSVRIAYNLGRRTLSDITGTFTIPASAFGPSTPGTADGVVNSVDLSRSGNNLTLTLGRSVGADLTDTVDLPTAGTTVSDGVANSVDLAVSGGNLTITIGRSGTLADLTDTVPLPATGATTADGVVNSASFSVNDTARTATLTLGRSVGADLTAQLTFPSPVRPVATALRELGDNLAIRYDSAANTITLDTSRMDSAHARFDTELAAIRARLDDLEN